LGEAEALYQQALALVRVVGDRRGEGIALCHLADLARLYTGDLEGAERLVDQAEALLTEVGAVPDLAKLLCTPGHLPLAAGRSAAELLARAGALARGSSAGPGSELGQKLSKLSRAQEAFETGQAAQLFRGELTDEIPAAIRGWLAARGLLPG